MSRIITTAISPWETRIEGFSQEARILSMTVRPHSVVVHLRPAHPGPGAAVEWHDEAGMSEAVGAMTRALHELRRQNTNDGVRAVMSETIKREEQP